MPEQRAIADALRTVENTVHARHREVELERERKAALMQHLFTYGTHGAPTKVTEIGEMPVSWGVAQLGELGSISGGGTPSTQEATYWGSTLPWLTPSEVTHYDGLFISDTERHITEAGLANTVARQLPPGTVMMTSRATIGEVVINRVPMSTNQGFINVVCDARRVHNEFFAYWIQRNRRVFVDRAHGVTFKEITKSNFKSVPIALPPLDEQRAIADVLSACDSKAHAVNREMAALDELFRALLEELMTGRLAALPLVAAETGVPA